MGGLLRALAGGIKGLGDGMIEKAKQDREDKLLALARSQHVEDRDVGIAATKANLDTSEAGATTREKMGNETSLATTGMNNDTSIKVGAANNATSIATNAATNRQSGIDTGMTTTTSRENNAATIAGQKDVANIRASAYNHKTDAIAGEYGKGKPLTYNQALQTARQAYKDNGGPVYNDDGSTVPPDQAISDIAAKLMKNGAAVQTGQTVVNPAPQFSGPSSAANFDAMPSGGLTTNLFGATPAAAPVVTPQAAPPPGAVQMLKQNPAMKDAFDQKYGQGAAARALGQ